mgnify:CR=1 FL=1
MSQTPRLLTFKLYFYENKDNFFRLNIDKDPTIEFSKDIEFDKTSQKNDILQKNEF